MAVKVRPEIRTVENRSFGHEVFLFQLVDYRFASHLSGSIGVVPFRNSK